MNSGRYTQVPAQAEITRKVFFDGHEARGRAMPRKGMVYPGGTDKNMLKVMPGELVFGRRRKLNERQKAGIISETGLTSLAGVEAGNKEELMNNYYFIGIAKTEYEYGGDNFMGQGPHGGQFSVISAGSYSTNNGSTEQIFAGDILVWEFPDVESYINSRGTPENKPLAYLRPLCTRPGDTFAAALAAGNNAVAGSPQRKLRDSFEAAKNKGSKELYEFVRDRVVDDLHRIVGVAMSSAAPGQTLDVMLSHYKVH